MRPLCFSLLLAAILLSGCSGKGKSTTYEIGIDPSWYPLQLAKQEKNVLAFSIELLTLIAKEENLQLALQKMNWDNLLWGLQEKKYSAVLSPLRPYTFYQSQYSFSEPYLSTGPILVVPKDSPIQNVKDLAGKEVAVVRGSSAALLLQTTPGILLQGYDSIAFALAALERQDVTAAALEVLVAQNYIRDLYKDSFKLLGSPLNNEGLRLISLLHNSPQLLRRFDQGLQTLKKKGDYEKLLRKWGLSPDGGAMANLDQEFGFKLGIAECLRKQETNWQNRCSPYLLQIGK